MHAWRVTRAVHDLGRQSHTAAAMVEHIQTVIALPRIRVSQLA